MIDQAIGLILQARMGSTRLPGKVLMPFGDDSLLGWIVKRLSCLPWKLVVATSDLEQDQAITDYCAGQTILYFRGSEKDVLDRYYKCAKEYGFSHVVRLTADNPFPDTEELQRLLVLHLEGHYDYSHSIGQLPIGVGAEVFSMAVLEASWRDGHEALHREHVNEYILENPKKFRIGHLEVPVTKRQPTLSLTIDTLADYQRVIALHKALGEAPVKTEELIEICTSSV